MCYMVFRKGIYGNFIIILVYLMISELRIKLRIGQTLEI